MFKQIFDKVKSVFRKPKAQEPTTRFMKMTMPMPEPNESHRKKQGPRKGHILRRVHFGTFSPVRPLAPLKSPFWR